MTTSTDAVAEQPNMESLQFLRDETAGRDSAPRPHGRIEREVDEMLQGFMDDKEVWSARVEAPADEVEVKIVEKEKKEHEVRWGVDITAVEEDPVEKIDVSLPGTSTSLSLSPSPFSSSLSSSSSSSSCCCCCSYCPSSPLLLVLLPLLILLLLSLSLSLSSSSLSLFLLLLSLLLPPSPFLPRASLPPW